MSTIGMVERPVAEVGDPGRRLQSGRPQPGAASDQRESGTVACPHCGTRFTPVAGRTEYCCVGCEYVYRLITGQKLDKFYALRRGAVSPVRSSVFQPRDYRWLEGLVKRAEDATGPVDGRQPAHGVVRSAQNATPSGGRRPPIAPGTPDPALDLDVQGISCIGCVWLIERVWRERAGAREIRINATLGRLTLRWTPGTCDVPAFAQELQRFGYLVGPATKSARTDSGALLWRIGLCAAFAMNGMLFSLPGYLGMEPDFPFAPLFTVLAFAFASASVLVGGTYFFRRSWQSLRRRVLHIDLPIALGILVGYGGSIYAWTQAHGGFTYFDFVATFTFLMLVGRWTQLAAVERNRNRLLGVREELPPVELVETEFWGQEAGDRNRRSENATGAQTPDPGHRFVATKLPSALVRGDRFRVAPGEVVPVSAALFGSAASFGLDWISGEADARAVQPGQIVESGAINLSPHAVRLEALEGWGDSLLARLCATPPPADWRNRTLESIIRIYIVAVLAIAALGGAGWFAATGDVTTALQVVVSVLVVSCPCATGVTLPLIDEMAVARLRQAGVFVRAETLWARLRRVRKVIFDKTGTLTLESLALRNPAALRALASEARAALWALVRAARHPAASCVREAMMAEGFGGGASPAEGAREEVGFGLEWRDGAGGIWRLGRESWVMGVGADPTGLARENDTTADLAFACDGRLLTRFLTGEDVREDAVAEISRLRARGLSVSILSGDRVAKVAAMAERLGLPAGAAMAGMTPMAKAEWVRGCDAGDTLMIGDGANDSLAFAAATCRGTPAIERGLLAHRADFFFLGRGLAGIGRLFAVSQRRARTMRRVIAFAIAYNAVVVAVALAGAMNPLLAAVLMPGSALVSLAIAGVGMRRG